MKTGVARILRTQKSNMKILEQLASSLGRRDEVPNQELAKKIADANDKKAMAELILNLQNKSRDIQHDCIKVLYEVGELKPKMLAANSSELIALLDSKNNRLQWGAMCALDAITSEAPATIFKALPKIIDAADKGTVITNDHCVGILVKLGAVKEYENKVFPLLRERILKSPVNQFPTYAEKTLPFVNEKNKEIFIQTLEVRFPEIEQESKRKRIEKILKKLSKI